MIEIGQLQDYITTGEEPLVKTELFEMAKRMLIEFGETFRKLADDLVEEDTIPKETLSRIISEVGTANKGRSVASFVFSVLVSTMFDLAYDIREVLP